MGWLWSSSSDDAVTSATPNESVPKQPPKETSVALTEEQRMRIFGRPSSTPSASSSASSQHTQADAELEALIQEFSPSDPSRARAGLEKAEQTALPAQDRHEPLPISRTLPDGSLDISPSAILPRTMSCRQAFDQAFYCQSVGGKFNDIYRYGNLRSCSEQWDAFWFCMRTRTLPEKEKEVEVVKYYQERDEKRRLEKGSSEDIWEIRTRAVDRAFWRDPDEDANDVGKDGISGPE